MLVLVYSDYCHFCRELKQPWGVLMGSLASSGVDVVEIDTNTLSNVPNGSNVLVDDLRNDVAGVPHIAFVTKDKRMVNYRGDRSPLDMMSFVSNNIRDSTAPAVTPRPTKPLRRIVSTSIASRASSPRSSRSKVVPAKKKKG